MEIGESSVNHKSGLLAEIEQLYRADGLEVPYIPAEMLPELKQLNPAVFSTRQNLPPPYAMFTYSEEITTQRPDDYLIFGHDGHGINSWALHYYLVRGPLALFVQVSWGTAYGDKAEDTARVNAKFAEAKEFIRTVETAEKQGKFKPGERLVVIDSDFNGRRWVFLEKVYTKENYGQLAEQIHEADDPMQAAREALESR